MSILLQAGKFMPQSKQNHRLQTIISVLIIAVLILIAAVIGLRQVTYTKSASEESILSDDLFGGDFPPAGDSETYNRLNLYIKIDGKADLYLNNGFASLSCRRFENKPKKLWAEVFLYEMRSDREAFAVYSLQKRTESTPLDWTQFGYSTGDSIYAAFGKYYMEIVLSSEDGGLVNSATAAGKKISSAFNTGKTQLPAFSLFPKENLVPDSFKFINADAFGCSDLKNIYTAEYKINNNLITAYISETEPGQLYEKYYLFLNDNGAKELSLNYRLPAYRAYSLFGTNEIFFFTPLYFAGVRGTASIEDLKIAFKELYMSLAYKKDEQR